MCLKSFCASETGGCPFYGFSPPFGMSQTMMPSGGNQCGAVTGGCAPCQMEQAGRKPEWFRCPLNQTEGDEILARYGPSVMVLPPPGEMGEESREVISFREWHEEVTGVRI